MFQGSVFKATLPSLKLRKHWSHYIHTISIQFSKKAQCYSVNRKRFKLLLFCTHSVTSTANKESLVFEISCVQVHVHVYTARYAIFTCLCIHAVLYFVKTCMCVLEQTLYIVKVRAIEQYDYQVKCQNCIALGCSYVNPGVSKEYNWFVYDSINYMRIGFNCSH